VLRARMPKGPTMIAADAAPVANGSGHTAVSDAAPEPAPPVAIADPVEAASAAPEMRPLTKDEMKRLEKARKEEEKADQRRRKEEEKAAKQAQKDAEKAMREAEKAARRSKQR
jgi:hypothetical protein